MNEYASLFIVLALILIYLFFNKKGYFTNKKNSKYTIDDESKYLTIDDKYNIEKVKKEKELNTLLDKISKKGIESLSEKEKKKLNDLSK